MKNTMKTLALAAALTLFATTAYAQDYNNWGVIDPYGMQMNDQFGNLHYTNPYAYDSQVDMYGNVISSDSGMLEPSLDYYDLTPVQPDYSGYGYDSGGYGSGGYDSGGYDSGGYVPYPGTTDSHESFINSIWD